VDEIPLSILGTKVDLVAVSVKAVGDATRHLHVMTEGQTIGLRGPFGNHFTLNPGRVLLVGGGTGTAPLLFLAKLFGKSDKIHFAVGAKSKDELLFLGELSDVCSTKTLITTTDDGSYGLQCIGNCASAGFAWSREI
jgi:dihydroorotate dehydrogenase electron transfer subunit